MTLEYTKGRTMKPEIIFAALLAFLSVLGGNHHQTMTALLILNVSDYITGMIASVFEAATGKGKGLSSKVGFKGVLKKVGFWVLVVVGHQADLALGLQDTVRNAVLYSLLGVEMLSITENLGRAGVPIPPVIMRVIAVLKGKGDVQVDSPEEERAA